MKILITGGLGHIGSYLLQNINKIKSLKKIYVVDNLSTQRYCSLFNIPKTKKKISFIKIDLSKKNALGNFPKTDVVIHLASMTDAEGSLKIKKKIYINNLGIFKNILQYCKKNSSKLIHLSSTSVYGEQKGLVDENCKILRPKSPYAEIKLLEEKILLKNKKKIKFITYRFGTISGVSKGMRFHTAINKFCFNCVLGKPLPLWKGMTNKPRPYLSLKDAFSVIKFTLEKNFFMNDVYNILSQNLTLTNIIKIFKKNKIKVKLEYHKSRLVNQYPYMVSNKKFSLEAFKLRSKIANDIKLTLKQFKYLSHEM
jgi:nucleoside-diphosphate-sugar epimerase